MKVDGSSSDEALEKEIERGRQVIHTDGYPMSIGEIASLYETDEIDIHPEFQRFFRWDDEQKSRLIESILLGIPIPSIFVAQQKGGEWDVIDGLQRLSTIFQLMGIWKDKDGKKAPPLVLTATKYLPALNGKTWSTGKDILSETQKLLIKRSKLDIKIIKRESSSETKYELFQRLNSGGTALSPQELRNCLLVMVNPQFFEWLEKLAMNPAFQACIAVSDAAREQRYDLELAVRFLVLRSKVDSQLKGVSDLGSYLDDEIASIATNEKFDLADEKRIFDSTFTALKSAFGGHEEDTFRRFDQNKDRFLGGFSIASYEAIALGLSNAIGKGKKIKNEAIVSGAKSIWSNAAYRKNSGSGVRASTRIASIIPLGRKIFS